MAAVFGARTMTRPVDLPSGIRTRSRALTIGIAALFYTFAQVCSAPPKAGSESCVDRCALFVAMGDHPSCQCDGLCLRHGDCCADYKAVCQVEIEPQKSSELNVWVGAIIGCVFALTVILAVIYFVAINRKGTRGVANLASYTCDTGEDLYTTTMAMHSEAPRDTASLRGSEQDLAQYPEPAKSPFLGSADSPGIVLVDATDGDVDSPASVL